MLPRPLAAASLVLLSALAGCGFFRRLAGTNTVDLEKANVKSMGVDIRKNQKTICPREEVQMAVFADVVLDGDKQVSKVETWQGRGLVNKNDKLDFADFAFQSQEGRFDPDGWFSPRSNLLVTTGHEFVIQSVYRRRPDKFTFRTTYKPDYECIKETGKNGTPGSAGSSGASGSPGSTGSPGAYIAGMNGAPSTQGPGGNGGPGGAGGPGGPGGGGGAGPHFRVYVAFVKTAFYDRLVALRITGDADDFLLFPGETVLAIHAKGGPGGHGGSGGAGGHGGAGGSGSPSGSPGSDGHGGNGGSGGAGGAGGSVELVYDARFPELAKVVNAEVAGGPGGGGGTGGSGGGSSGAGGRSGPDGHASFSPSSVSDRFAGLPGVSLP